MNIRFKSYNKNIEFYFLISLFFRLFYIQIGDFLKFSLLLFLLHVSSIVNLIFGRDKNVLIVILI
jgi:hypothetical protein